MNISDFYEAEQPKKKKDSIIGKAVSTVKENLIKAKAIAFGQFNRRGTNPGSRIYDLERIKNAILTDSYLSVAIRKFSQLITKAGYQIKSKNEAASDYINDRLRIIEFRSKIPFYVLVTSIAKDLYTFSNSYIIKTRDNDTQKFGIKADQIFKGGAISGLFLADPCSVTIQRGDDGRIDHYLIDGEEYSPNDVIHLYIDKMNNAEYGTSRMFTVLEDASMLRKAEGLVMTILYRFATPILHIKVGNIAEGQYATQKEIDDARNAFQDMPNDGFIVTNERTTISSVTPDMKANDLLNFLSYMEQRIFTGLNASKSSMGRGGGQSSADNTEALMHDEVKAFQNVISSFIEKYLFTELLLEGGFNPLTNKDDYVFFDFNEVSIDTKIKVESHTIQKYQGNVITLEEARRELGFDNEVSETDMYAFKVTLESQLEQIDAQADASIKTSKETMQLQSTQQTSNDGLDERSFNGKKKQSTPNKYFSNDANPQNQNTIQDNPIAKEFVMKESMEDNIKDYEKNFSDIHASYSRLGNILASRGSTKPVVTELSKKLNKHLTEFARRGVNDSHANNKTNGKIIDPIVDSFEDYSSKKINKIVEDLKSATKNNKDKIYIDNQLSKTEYRLRFLCDYLTKKAYWWNYVQQCKADHVKTIEIQFENSDHQNGRMTHFDIDKITIEDIPAYTPYCKCSIKPIMKG